VDLWAAYKLLIYVVVALTLLSFGVMCWLGFLDPVTAHQIAIQEKIFDIVSKAFLSGLSFFTGAVSSISVGARRGSR
jgi:hypothetical protein